MYASHSQIEIEAAPAQVFDILSNPNRLPEWYVPSEKIEVLTPGPVCEGWQFHLSVRTLGGVLLKALGTVTSYQPESYAITWRGKTLGIEGDSRWQATAQNGHTVLKHTFEGEGWMLFLSKKLGRNDMTVQKRLSNLKALVEGEIGESKQVRE